MKRINLSYALFALVVILSSLSLVTAQEQGNVKSYFELSQLGDVPGDLKLSTSYLTIVEFEGHRVEDVKSAGGELFEITASGNFISIRALDETINTDLIVRVNGQTVLFKMQSDEQAVAPRRYVVRDTPSVPRGNQGFSGRAGAPRPPATANAPLFPQGLLFEADFFRPRQTEIVIQYRLINESQHPIINDPYRLRIYYGDSSVEYDRESSPASGRPNYLAPGESEFGQIVIPKAPNDIDELELEWVLTEVGPGTQHKLIRNLAELAEISPDLRRESVATPPEAVDASGGVDTPEVVDDEILADSSAFEDESVAASESDNLLNDTPASAPEQTFVDSTFDTDGEDWYVWAEPDTGAAAVGGVSEGENCTDVSANGAEAWHVRFALGGLPLPAQDYVLRYDAYVEGTPEFALSTGIILDAPPYTSYAWNGDTLSGEKKTFEHRFTLDKENDDKAMLSFLLGKEGENSAPYRVCFDNVQLSSSAAGESLAETPLALGADAAENVEADTNAEQSPALPKAQGAALVDSDFEAGLEEAWKLYTQESAEATIESRDGEACISVNQAGEKRFHVGFLQLNHTLNAGQNYTFSFDAHSELPVEIQSIVSFQEDPWTDYQKQTETLEPTKRSYTYTFTMPEDQNKGRIIFEVGGEGNTDLGAYEFCLDNIYLGEVAGQVANE